MPKASGTARKIAAGGHEDGAETQQAGLVDGFLRALPLLAFRGQGEIDHHDGVFFTMPMSRITPISEITFRSR